MGLFRIIYGSLYPSGPTQTYKDKQSLTTKSSAPETNTTPWFRFRFRFRPTRYRFFFLGGLRNLRRKPAGLLIACVFLAAVAFYLKSQYGPAQRYQSWECTFPPDNGAELGHRASIDTFAKFKHRGVGCDVSSLDLHKPFGSLCPDKNSVLRAMSNGGRAGKDAPYVPRGCDMRWYDTKEVCEILNRFSQVVLVGDSMLRHIIGALNVVIREDLGYGGVTDWNFSDEERYS